MSETNDAAADADGEICIPINVSEQIEFCFARGWTDGLPVVPASRALVDEMLEGGGLKPETIIADMPSRKVAVTAEKSRSTPSWPDAYRNTCLLLLLR